MGNLVLTQKEGDRIFIGDNIILKTVTVDALHKSVRYAINAPKEIAIVREDAKDKGKKHERPDSV